MKLHVPFIPDLEKNSITVLYIISGWGLLFSEF